MACSTLRNCQTISNSDLNSNGKSYLSEDSFTLIPTSFLKKSRIFRSLDGFCIKWQPISQWMSWFNPPPPSPASIRVKCPSLSKFFSQSYLELRACPQLFLIIIRITNNFWRSEMAPHRTHKKHKKIQALFQKSWFCHWLDFLINFLTIFDWKNIMHGIYFWSLMFFSIPTFHFTLPTHRVLTASQRKMRKSYQDFPRGMNTIQNITNKLSRFRFYLNKRGKQTAQNDNCKVKNG